MSQAHTTDDRRRTPRFAVDGRIEGEHPPAGPITVLEISRGGLSARVDRECRVGSRQPVRLWSASCPPVVLHATVIHSVCLNDQEPTQFLVGLEFVHRETPPIRQAIDALLASVDAGQRSIVNC